MPIVAASVLAADFSKLGAEASAVVAAGSDWLHVDVMDGHFVPPITFGAIAVSALRRSVPSVTLDVHLMIEQPDLHLKDFADAGADRITVQVEACPHVHQTVRNIQALGKKAGVALNPGTPVEAIEEIVPLTDLVLVMTVNPGWGGQEFIRSTLAKIRRVRELIAQSGRTVHLEVDGGINAKTARECVTEGADVLVAGTSIFKAADYAAAISALR